MHRRSLHAGASLDTNILSMLNMNLITIGTRYLGDRMISYGWFILFFIGWFFFWIVPSSDIIKHFSDWLT